LTRTGATRCCLKWQLCRPLDRISSFRLIALSPTAAVSFRCIAVGGHAAWGCDPNRPIGRSATRLQVSGTARTSRAPLTGLGRIADVHRARQRGVWSGGTWMSAVRVGELTLSTHCSPSGSCFDCPEAVFHAWRCCLHPNAIAITAPMLAASRSGAPMRTCKPPSDRYSTDAPTMNHGIRTPAKPATP
jgi:hypothetical protein